MVTPSKSIKIRFYNKKHAHALAEAYDKDAQRWVLVESTPSSGVPVPSLMSPWQQRREAMANFFRSVQDHVKRGNYKKALWLAVLPLLWIIAAFGSVAGLFVLLKRRLPKKRQATIELDKSHTMFSRERMHMDRLLAKFGLHRLPNETTTQFADRIETDSLLEDAAQFSQWYRHYSTCRFRPGFRPGDIEELRIQREKMSRVKTRTSE